MASQAEQFTFEKILVPIIAAVVTTLIVEYFAKPKLEARKARLIRDRQQLDELIFQFQKTSLAFGALLPDSYKHPTKDRHNKLMLENATSGLYGIMEALSRLSHKYAQKHSDHIGKTAKYVGYLITQVDRASSPIRMENPVDSLKKKADSLSSFDVYFLANVGVKDSQERWYRRLFWHLFTKASSADEVDKVLKKYNLARSNEK